MNATATTKTPLNEKEVWTETEFVEVTGISRQTLRKLRNSGQLGFLRVGDSVRYARKHLDEFIRKNERKLA
ncbi:MAG: helix-turn-helix domain-containing protein [Blastocatellia bacterium]|nr:helix-turn-helix domain-containing protein [Blastocatellia bacterium]